MNPRKFLFFLVVLLVAGVAGFFFRGWQQDQVAASGWCCIAGGSACTQSKSADACDANGGQLFDRSQTSCNSFCQSLPPS